MGVPSESCVRRITRGDEAINNAVPDFYGRLRIVDYNPARRSRSRHGRTNLEDAIADANIVRRSNPIDLNAVTHARSADIDNELKMVETKVFFSAGKTICVRDIYIVLCPIENSVGRKIITDDLNVIN